MNIEIKKAKITDLQKIQELNSILLKEEYDKYPDKYINLDWSFSEESTQSFKNSILSDDCYTLIVIVENNIVGLLSGGITKGETYRNLPKIAELGIIFVLKEYRSQGIGQKLFDAFFKWCIENNVKKIRLEVSAQNENAIKLYKKNGFWEYTLIMENDI